MTRPTRRKVAPFPYPESCVGYSPVRLAAASLAHQVTCTWVCINAALHCISAAHAGFVAQRGYLKGQEWESGCKAHVNAKFDLNGTDVVVAGLFGGDYLPLLAAKVGRRGTVYGFEPTDAVNVSRALADANSLANVKIQQACLSNDTSEVRMCVRNPKAHANDTYSTFGDRTHIVRADEDTGGGGARCGHGNADAAGGFVHTRCKVLDESLPWQSTRVGFLLLDVEGAEEKVLLGAIGLLHRWRPILATEPRLHRISPVFFSQQLAGLGYVHRGGCDGLNFYEALTDKHSEGKTRRA